MQAISWDRTWREAPSSRDLSISLMATFSEEGREGREGKGGEERGREGKGGEGREGKLGER